MQERFNIFYILSFTAYVYPFDFKINSLKFNIRIMFGLMIEDCEDAISAIAEL
jgi:hypothetical protein